MRRYKLLILFSFYFSFGYSQKGNIDKFSSWKSGEPLQGALVSYYFYDLDDQKEILQYNEDQRLNPASTLKLLTALSFLDKFGEEYRYTTQVYSSGKLSEDGILNGNIIVKGNGDPSFGSHRFGDDYNLESQLQKITNAIKNEGIQCIEGNIIIDASLFGTDATPHSWPYNDLGNYYAAGVWSVNANENRYAMTLNRTTKVGSKVSIRNTTPQIPFFKATSELTTGSAKSGDQAYIFCAPYQHQAIVRGTIPAAKGVFTIHGSIPNPPFFLAKTIEDRLASEGIHSQGSKVSYSPVDVKKEIINIPSLPSKKLVEHAIKYSINMYCESFLKSIGNGDRQEGVDQIKAYLERKNINQAEFRMEDGSGLSTSNQISAKTLTRFIRYQYNTRGNSLKNLLAKSGESGTFKNTFTKYGLKGKVYGKSGSMEGVRAYTGIMETNSGHEIAFTVMVNHYTSPNWKMVQYIENLLAMVSKQY